MGLIKAEHAPSSLVPFSMKDVENQAKAILLRARQQAERLLAEAQAEAELLRQQAKADGLAEGRREGTAKGLEEGKTSGHDQALAQHAAAMTSLVNALTNAAAQLNASRQELEANALVEVVELAAAIARRATKRQGMIDGGVLTENLREAMRLVVHASDVRIAVHPAQKKTLEAELPNLRLAWPQLKHVELTEDATLVPGGCRIFTAHGMVDGDLETQLDRVIDELLPKPEALGV